MIKIFLSKKVIGPIIIIILFLMINIIVSKLVKKITKTKLVHDEKKKRTMISLLTNIFKYFLLTIAILMILNLYGIDTTALITSLGVVGLIAGLAAQDLLKDFLSGMAIIFENQYSIGDTITIDGFKGEVISLGLKTTKIMAYTGEVKIISNRNVMDVINHSISPSLAIVDIPISYEEDLNKVEEVLNNICNKLSKELKNIKGKVELVGIEQLANSSIIYRIQVKTEPLKHYEVKRILFREIKLELDKNKITIPYEQVVIHNEGL